jgi:hypothetical protein
MPFFRKYGDGANGWVKIPIPKAGVNDFAGSGDWTPATGDVKISKDDGSQANIGTLPTYSNGGWKFTFTNAELQAKEIHVAIVDGATKAIDDQYFIIETYGDASAKYVNDLSTNVPNTTAPDNAGIADNGGAIEAVGTSLGAVASAVTSLGSPAQASALTTVGTNVTRILAVSGDNQVLDDTTYDVDNNLTAGTVYCYDTKAHATAHDKTTGLIAKYTIANTISSKNVTLGKQLRES